MASTALTPLLQLLALAPAPALLSVSEVVVAIVTRVIVLVLVAFVVRVLLARLPWLPLPITLFALVHWHSAVRALVSCALVAGECSVSTWMRDASALRVVDVLGSLLLRVAHVHTLAHEYELPYWALYLFGSLSVGGVSFWYLHLLFLSVDVHASKQQTRRVFWASDLLAWVELAALLTVFAVAAPLVYARNWAALLDALPLSSLMLLPSMSAGVSAVTFEQFFVLFTVLAWFVPRVAVPNSRWATWLLRLALVAACAFNITLALSLAISSLRLWPLTQHQVPTRGVYGLVR